STDFVKLGGAQAKALGHPDLPIAVIPHPFGVRTRDEVRALAGSCADDIARLMCEAGVTKAQSRSDAAAPAVLVEVPGDLDEFNRFFMDRRWGDGMPVVPPTKDRVARMLKHTRRAPNDIVAFVAPAFGSATVERVAINAVMAGCHPEYLPVLLAATEAISVPEFNLQSIQTTTNPVTPWLIVNGPIVRRLNINFGINCLGQGSWANATLGRALRLILQNIGGCLPGEMDRATQGQPGKFTFCCAENEEANPWEPLHVERGFDSGVSTVTVAGAAGTWNMNTHAKDAADLLRVIADTMIFPAGSDFTFGGAPWLVLAPEHAQVLKREGLSKVDVKRRLWGQAKLAASRLSAKDFARVQAGRRAELGEITRETLLPISVKPDDINFIVAGGPGTHSIYIPASGHVHAVTRKVDA
ncbi:MAG TPA: UGSC family (seleno)protein, partial [Candidatus Didemnitutus sp.]